MKISGEMNNVEIAELLDAVAAAYKIKDPAKNKFRIVAYERAADAVEHLSSEAKDLWDEGKLADVAGIGDSIAEHLGEIFKFGKSRHFEEVMQGIPPATFDLLKVSGVGPKTAFRMTTELGINSLAELKKAAESGKIAKMEGFGQDSQKAILQSLSESSDKTKRLLLPYATKLAGEIVDWMRECKQVQRIETLGSLRRKASTIGDIDLAVASDAPEVVINHFTKYPHASRVLEKGERTAAIIVPGNKQGRFDG